MKKILWLPGWYPNRLNPFAGDFIQRHAMAVSMFQPVQVIFVIKDESLRSNKKIWIEKFQKENLHETIVYIKPFRTGIRLLDRLISLLTYIKVYKGLIQEFTEKELYIELVHVHVAMWAGVLALWIKRKFKIRYIITEHWTGYEKKAKDNVWQKDIFYKIYLKKVLRNASLLMPVNTRLEELITSNFLKLPSVIIPNVVDTKYFSFNPLAPPIFRFIHVSDLGYQKNCIAIINCFAKLLQHQKNVELVMIGPADVNLKRITERPGLQEHFIWKGEVSYTEVANEMKQASCFIMFSLYENLPCVVLEALCCGLPVISSNVGGIPEVITAENGILVNVKDENDLLAAMKKMIDNYEKYDRQQISIDAEKKFNYEKVGKEVVSVYETLLKS